MRLRELLQTMHERGASDLHLQAGSPPVLRINGKLTRLGEQILGAEDIQGFVEEVTSPAQRQRLEERRAVDLGYAVEGLARFRVAVFYERGNPAMVFRLIPTDPIPLEELNLPSVVGEIALIERGLVLVTGTTGSGKSTTLAGMIDLINHRRASRIITIEDPIEYVHKSDKSLIAQREIGPDASGFLPALREALREDPDVILIGELRDQETVATALQAADTGHAVFATIHTTSAWQTVERIIAMFPQSERDLIFMLLANNLEAVISQRLARTLDGKARIPVVEILRNIPVVRKILLDHQPEKLPAAIATGESGMQLFDQHLAELYRADVISGTEAMRLATNPEAVALAKRNIRNQDLSGGLVR